MFDSTDPSDRLETSPFQPGTLRIGALLGLLGVGLGAFGAHGLEGVLEESALSAADQAKRIDWWNTAAQYQLVHAVCLVAMGALSLRLRAASICMALGVAIFSGTLYGLALGAPSWFGAITPVGGLLLLAGWLLILLGSRAEG